MKGGGSQGVAGGLGLRGRQKAGSPGEVHN